MRTATSTYNLELIEKRIAYLCEVGEMVDAAAETERQRELAYLEDLKRRKFPEAA